MVVHRLAVLVDEPRRRPKLLVKPIALRGRAIVGRCVALHRRVGRARVAAIRIRAGGHRFASGCHRADLIARKSAAAMQTVAEETQSGARADSQHRSRNLMTRSTRSGRLLACPRSQLSPPLLLQLDLLESSGRAVHVIRRRQRREAIRELAAHARWPTTVRTRAATLATRRRRRRSTRIGANLSRTTPSATSGRGTTCVNEGERTALRSAAARRLPLGTTAAGSLRAPSGRSLCGWTVVRPRAPAEPAASALRRLRAAAAIALRPPAGALRPASGPVRASAADSVRCASAAGSVRRPAAVRRSTAARLPSAGIIVVRAPSHADSIALSTCA